MTPSSGQVEPDMMVESSLVEIVGFDGGEDSDGDQVVLGLVRDKWNPGIPLQAFTPSDADPQVVARLLRLAADHIEQFGLPIDLAYRPKEPPF
jgi:hypothetical protein